MLQNASGPILNKSPGRKTKNRVLLFGGSGLLGSELHILLKREGHDLWAPSSGEVDCREEAQVLSALRHGRPDVVVMAAAKVGGILANMKRGSEFLRDNVRMNFSVLNVCAGLGVSRVLVFGSSCMYPKDINRPLVTEDLLTAPVEPTSELYALSKILTTKYAQALRREGKCCATVCVPNNLYGDGDRFSAEEGHLISSLIVKMHQAKLDHQPRLELWGDGTPRRDFLHAEDAARACLAVLETENPPEIVHFGTGQEFTIRQIAEKVAQAVGFSGEIVFTGLVSNGASRKWLAVDWLFQQGWRPRVSMEEGIRRAYQAYLSQQAVGISIAGEVR